MRSLLLAVLMSILVACATIPPAPVTSVPVVAVCEPVALRCETLQVGAGNIDQTNLIQLVRVCWVDLDCDGKCDTAVALEYAGLDANGVPIFEQVGELYCTTADELLNESHRIGDL